ncbi:thioredoxin-disulfide reductase [Pseudoruminococcus massiliensis]|uniref:thioredoxin-disulfide reductase n=1 Tax=Pseudoruminococcus massiliensis TaxID=2086583 RepID=UPI000D0EE476|nr:thioredoxin-disulfide reductase [Pseudoruminococcus massiliensis]
MRSVDVLIIGSGPAGLAAAIYTGRAMRSTVVCERDYMSTGQIVESDCIDNYPGLPNIEGYELGEKFKAHAQAYGTEFIEDEVIKIEKSANGSFVIKFKSDNLLSVKAIIYAAGASHRKLGIDGEFALRGAGVSYCAVCDGAFFKDKTTVVIGGGDTALGDALLLSKICKQVFVIYRGEKLRAAKSLQNKANDTVNIDIIYNAIPTSFNGDKHLSSISLKNTKTGKTAELNAEGAFIAIGSNPNSQILKGLVELDKSGYVVADETGKTSVSGIFVAGDVRTKALRQVVTAVSDGANAAISAENYINQIIK